MRLGKKKDKRKPGEITPAYLPRIMEELRAEKIDPAMGILNEAALDYFSRFNRALDTVNGQDAAIVIKLFRHMADELERADPYAAKVVKAMEKISLPPIEFKAVKGGGK